jgi:DNA repair metallo-beta-lactamase
VHSQMLRFLALMGECTCPQVPYSEHSSFEELRDMVATLQVLPASNYLTFLTPNMVLCTSE